MPNFWKPTSQTPLIGHGVILIFFFISQSQFLINLTVVHFLFTKTSYGTMLCGGKHLEETRSKFIICGAKQMMQKMSYDERLLYTNVEC